MKYRQTSSITSKRKVNLNNNNSGNSDSNGNSHTTASTNDSNPSRPNNNDTNCNNNSSSNNSNHTNTNNSGTKNNNNYHHQVFKSESSESSQEEELHITPRSLIGNLTPRRLTPSRRDSYNRSNSSSSNTHSGSIVKTPNSAASSSIFDFSNLISEQKQLQQKKLNEEHLKANSLFDELKYKLKTQMNSSDTSKFSFRTFNMLC